LSQRYGLNHGFDEYTYEKEILDLTAPSKVGEMALDWLSKRHRKPFFLFLHFFDVHSDYRALPKYLKQFVRPYYGFADGSTAQLLAFRAGKFSLDDDAVNHMIDMYDASIRQIDDGIGRLLTFLESKNLFDKSLITITSDHGEEFLDHGGVLHSETMYEELIHVPLIICGPGIPKSRRIRNVVSHVDLMPTILSFLGMALPLLQDGVDVSGFWKTNDFVVPERYLFSEGSKGNIIPDEHSPKHDIKRAVRHPRYKMHYDILSEQIHLYDLDKDRREKNDIASKHPRLVDVMFSQLKDFMAVNKTGRSLGPLSQEEIERLKSLGYL
jgi:arylsulfatase A-like enzyme